MSSVPTSCFERCTSLTSFTFGANLTSLGNSSLRSTGLDGEVNLQYVTSIGSWCFCNDTSITGVTFSYNLATIGNSTFWNCTSLAGDIEVPLSVATVGYCAFRNTKITSLTFLGDSTVITPGYWNTSDGRGYRTLR